MIWQVGESSSNIIESLHADANNEGISCTLVGGVKKGQFFDKMKLQSLQVCWVLSFIASSSYRTNALSNKVYETTGIRPLYKNGHVSDNILRGVKRKSMYHNSPSILRVNR